ncbi:hypothetical protein [Oharaeibacter diazotrophicus]|uniref:Uncharacterized protein n=1 Tax=Oharaeibacter diazotrophicus TaxID=1920512 RepID=A0A4R6RIU9_9HYPH|nr:hypothetical protein [Oharaeibacter diazotrophicus]TDP86459.1 hypothetical protein EDD54_0334 [Oharaeibacter diazotrophicus]BBE71599.1 hypothetical protein OHA_1_01177 [Pleomorphomonas sp. SM30]GLS78361.1 hypothetical protein GCM10007904_36980 [Oharaeibacter diazotrophicus]
MTPDPLIPPEPPARSANRGTMTAVLVILAVLVLGVGAATWYGASDDVDDASTQAQMPPEPTVVPDAAAPTAGEGPTTTGSTRRVEPATTPEAR